MGEDKNNQLLEEAMKAQQSSLANKTTNTQQKTIYPERKEEATTASEKHKVEGLDLTPEERASLMTPHIQFTPSTAAVENSPTFQGIMRKARDREAMLRNANISDQERERKRSKYLAWTNFLNSIGRVAGGGYAPQTPNDDSRVLASFKKLDALRQENRNIVNDPYLSWVEKLTLQQQLQNAANDIARRDAIAKRNSEIDVANANALIKSANKVTRESSMSNTDKTKSGYTVDTNRSSTTNGGAGTEFTRIGKDLRFGITLPEALAIKNEIVDLLNASDQDISGMTRGDGYIVTPMGAMIDAKKFNNSRGALSKLASQIMDEDALSNPEGNKTQIQDFVSSVNAMSSGNNGYDMAILNTRTSGNAADAVIDDEDLGAEWE